MYPKHRSKYRYKKNKTKIRITLMAVNFVNEIIPLKDRLNINISKEISNRSHVVVGYG